MQDRMTTFQKLKELKRVPFEYKLKIINYYIKRKLGFTFTEEERIKESHLHSFLIRLAKYDGKVIHETEDTYTAVYGQHPIKVVLRKFPSTDIYVFDQIYGRLDYEPIVELLLNRTNLTKENPLNIIDAGGNIGLTSIYFSAFFPNSNFIIVEPSDSNFAILKRNVEENIKGNINLIKGGVWNNDSDLVIKKDFRGGGDWALRVEETTAETPDSIKGFTIPTLMKTYNFDHVDILKIDIEGSEKFIFSKDHKDLDFLAKTRCIAIEIHDEFECREDIYSCLESYGFTHTECGELTIGFNTRFS